MAIHGDLNRIRTATAQAEFDGLLAFGPDNYYYLSGHQGGFGRSGLSVAFLPADENVAPALTCTSFEETWARSHTHIQDVRPIQLWLEIDDVKDLEQGTTVRREKPTQHDPGQVFRILADVFRERHLEKARIGGDLGHLSASFLDGFKQTLPGVTLVDATPLYWELRAIKTQEEIAAQREAVRLSEIGFRAIVADENPRGKTVSQLKLEFQLAIGEAVRNDPGVRGLQSSRAFITAGGDISPSQSRNEHVIADGDVIFIDFGATVDGYASDMGRTVSVGEPRPVTQRAIGAMLAGFEAGWPLLKAGTTFKDLFLTTEAAIRANGLPTITRGHYGHTIGTGGGEQPPFIAPTESRQIAPGMVLAFEVPYYVRGLGGFQCEDNVVITGNGVDDLSTLPHQLFVV
ncbi:MAG: M24 family metallopeptidase [Anaerolineae bacterium]